MRIRGWGTRWEWEKSEEVAVFATDSNVGQEKSAVVKELEGVLKEFPIPISVIDGNLKNSEAAGQIQTVFDNSIKNSEIDYDKFEEELLKVRERGRLHYGLVILVDKGKHEFSHLPEQREQAIYGVGDPSGWLILRHTHREAVRHEFGHMLGLGVHHSGCVMDYRCVIDAFCNQCKQQIEEMWQEEIGRRQFT